MITLSLYHGNLVPKWKKLRDALSQQETYIKSLNKFKYEDEKIFDDWCVEASEDLQQLVQQVKELCKVYDLYYNIKEDLIDFKNVLSEYMEKYEPNEQKVILKIVSLKDNGIEKSTENSESEEVKETRIQMENIVETVVDYTPVQEFMDEIGIFLQMVDAKCDEDENYYQQDEDFFEKEPYYSIVNGAMFSNYMEVSPSELEATGYDNGHLGEVYGQWFFDDYK